jgi:hypothetical protein
MSLEDYSGEVEALVEVMNRDVDGATATLDGPGVTTEDVAEAFKARSLSRARFVDALGDFEPPDEAAELHREALEIVERLGEAEGAVAARAASFPVGTAPAAVEQTEEARALDAIDAEAIALCELAEDAFDATAAREGFAGSSWMPAELKAAVDVAFRCTAAERGGA